MTGLDLIGRSLRMIGVLGGGETVGADDARDGLIHLNDLIDLWATKGRTIYVCARSLYTLSSGVQTYTIGSGGDFNQARPLWLPLAGVIINGQELPLRVLRSAEEWARRVPIKATTGTQPQKVYYDFAFPLGNVSFWPVPSVAGVQVALYTPTALTAFADLSTDYTFPPAYARALRTHLAIAMAPEYGVEPSVTLIRLAAESLADIKRANARPEELRCDPALTVGRGNSYDITTNHDYE